MTKISIQSQIKFTKQIKLYLCFELRGGMSGRIAVGVRSGCRIREQGATSPVRTIGCTRNLFGFNRRRVALRRREFRFFERSDRTSSTSEGVLEEFGRRDLNLMVKLEGSEGLDVLALEVEKLERELAAEERNQPGSDVVDGDDVRWHAELRDGTESVLNEEIDLGETVGFKVLLQLNKQIINSTNLQENRCLTLLLLELH